MEANKFAEIGVEFGTNVAGNFTGNVLGQALSGQDVDLDQDFLDATVAGGAGTALGVAGKVVSGKVPSALQNTFRGDGFWGESANGAITSAGGQMAADGVDIPLHRGGKTTDSLIPDLLTSAGGGAADGAAVHGGETRYKYGGGRRHRAPESGPEFGTAASAAGPAAEGPRPPRGSRPASARALRSRNSIWALALRSSSSAQRVSASCRSGSSRSSTCLPPPDLTRPRDKPNPGCAVEPFSPGEGCPVLVRAGPVPRGKCCPGRPYARSCRSQDRAYVDRACPRPASRPTPVPWENEPPCSAGGTRTLGAARDGPCQPLAAGAGELGSNGARPRSGAGGLATLGRADVCECSGADDPGDPRSFGTFVRRGAYSTFSSAL
ncbi:hypothetical protein GCM10010211_46110 [Streptomyces albospinus]|uniref:Uncharacterized protein n=1 Tax=Streptomyces albospinus TaxID=285515 RepID=A0ABQ2VAD4_9ACTN|nr:hypothetical protein GCM10010211_46110 [Streptomyces albospinus]